MGSYKWQSFKKKGLELYGLSWRGEEREYWAATEKEGEQSVVRERDHPQVQSATAILQGSRETRLRY